MFSIDQPFANANTPRTIRFTEELFQELGDTAQAHNVSFNLLVLQCCRYALDNLGEGRKKSEER